MSTFPCALALNRSLYPITMLRTHRGGSLPPSGCPSTCRAKSTTRSTSQITRRVETGSATTDHPCIQAGHLPPSPPPPDHSAYAWLSTANTCSACSRSPSAMSPSLSGWTRRTALKYPFFTCACVHCSAAATPTGATAAAASLAQGTTLARLASSCGSGALGFFRAPPPMGTPPIRNAPPPPPPPLLLLLAAHSSTLALAASRAAAAASASSAARASAPRCSSRRFRERSSVRRCSSLIRRSIAAATLPCGRSHRTARVRRW
mmetsp:Transcript_7065/g.22366  ORF Transcript_7065/g.22366 Transcript_7065/m.22366 type:complete len:262 (+) Transcript_7065:17-802(+)